MTSRFNSKIVTLVILLALLFPVIRCSSPKKNTGALKIALVQYNDSPLSELSRAGIEEGLTQSGWTAGKDYELKSYNAQGDITTLNLIFDAVLNERPRLVLVTSTPTLQVALKKIKEIPVVFTVVADPVLAGAGKSFSEHLSNVTGISTMGDYEGMIGLIKTVVPGTTKIGTLYTPGEINSVRNMNVLKSEAEKNGIELITVPVASSAETADATLSLIARQPSIVCQIVDNLTSVSISSILKVCQEHNVPMFGFVSDQAEKGAVLVLSRDYHQAGMDAAVMVKKIIEGTDPASIPFEFVSKTNILINQAASDKSGIKIPDEVFKKDNVTVIK